MNVGLCQTRLTGMYKNSEEDFGIFMFHLILKLILRLRQIRRINHLLYKALYLFLLFIVTEQNLLGHSTQLYGNRRGHLQHAETQSSQSGTNTTIVTQQPQHSNTATFHHRIKENYVQRSWKWVLMLP